jgi:hypothetical protein
MAPPGARTRLVNSEFRNASARVQATSGNTNAIRNTNQMENRSGMNTTRKASVPGNHRPNQPTPDWLRLISECDPPPQIYPTHSNGAIQAYNRMERHSRAVA